MEHPFEHRAHWNPVSGEVCHCPWGVSDRHHEEHFGATKEATKLEWLEGRPDLQTPEGEKALNFLKGVNGIHYDPYSDFSKADKMLPWLIREWRKGRLNIPSDEDPNYLLGFTYRNRNGEEKLLNPGVAEDMQRSLEEMKQRGMGIDIMQHKVHELIPKVQEYQDWKKSQDRKDLGEVLHQFPDGWTVRRLQNPEEYADEGEQMGHCIGTDPTYAKDAEEGIKMHVSLRDPKNLPHATMELYPHYWENPETGEAYGGRGNLPPGELGWIPKISPDSEVGQFYGKEDSPPKEDYINRMKDWLESQKAGVPIEWKKNPPIVANPPVMAAQIQPLYFRWVYSPSKGVTLGTNADDHPALVKYHQALGGDINDNDLTHGYAYPIINGWRLTDLDHQAVQDPYIVNQVVRALNHEDGPQKRAEGSWQPTKFNWDRIHYSLPQEATF